MNRFIDFIWDKTKDMVKIKKFSRHFIVFILLAGLFAACDSMPAADSFVDLLPGNEDILDSAQTEVLNDAFDTENAEADVDVQPFTGEIEIKESSSYVSSEGDFAFQNQPGSPVSIASWSYDCNWTGIAGQVFYDGENPVKNIVVEAGGTLAGTPIVEVSITGSSLEYGLGGYEIQLSDHTENSSGTVWVQLKDISGLLLSPKVYIDTHDDCTQNLTILNFIKYDTSPFIVFYYPIFFR